MSSQPSTAEWLSAFAGDLASIGFSDQRIDALLCVALDHVLRDNPLRLDE